MNENILCCDWGTSSFRLRVVNTSNYNVIAEHQQGEGVAATFKSWQADGSTNRFDFYASKLKVAMQELAQSSATDLSDIPVIVSGMASSSIGMEEIAYAPLPFAIDGSQASAKIFEDFNGTGASLFLISGVRSDEDVMRGEEAQLIGLCNLNEIALEGNDNSLFVFPGTHSKHISVQRGDITGFKTFMTGEIFNVLSEYSILKDSILHNSDLMANTNMSAFRDGVGASASSNLLHTLFTVRTNQLFGKYPKELNAFYLSGLLIGTELRQLSTVSYNQLIICSGRHLFNHYKLAAEALGLADVTFIEPDLIDKATIAGQIQLFTALNDFYE